MTVQTMPGVAEGDITGRAWALALAIGVLLLGLIFREECAAAVTVWYDSTAYSHCFFVIPIAAYLVWDRRADLVGVPIIPAFWAALAAVPLGIAWIAAERLGIMEGRQLVAMSLVEILFVTVLGWRMSWAVAAPLLYLYFLVPFGAFLTPVLQSITAWFIYVGLDVIGIPFNSDGLIIEIPAGRFYVAEACAGLRFLIASIAFGALYAVLMYRSPGRRVAFLVASVVIPIAANGLRALGIVLLGHVLGSAQAAAADHLLYGWIFFSIVILLLILAGLPFREDPGANTANPNEAEGDASSPTTKAAISDFPTPGLRPSLISAGLVVAVAGIGPLGSLLIDRAGQIALITPPIPIAQPAGCQSLAVPQEPMPAGTARQLIRCGNTDLMILVQLFSPRANPSRIIAAQRAATGEAVAGDASISGLNIEGGSPSSWRLAATEEPSRVTASALWVNGRPAQGGLAGRVALARNSVSGSSHAPVLVAIGTPPGPAHISPGDVQHLRAVITTFIRTQPDLNARIAQLAEAAARGQTPP
jgi:exosortase A